MYLIEHANRSEGRVVYTESEELQNNQLPVVRLVGRGVKSPNRTYEKVRHDEMLNPLGLVLGLSSEC